VIPCIHYEELFLEGHDGVILFIVSEHAIINAIKIAAQDYRDWTDPFDT
jgi:hypothetical protein